MVADLCVVAEINLTGSHASAGGNKQQREITARIGISAVVSGLLISWLTKPAHTAADTVDDMPFLRQGRVVFRG